MKHENKHWKWPWNFNINPSITVINAINPMMIFQNNKSNAVWNCGGWWVAWRMGLEECLGEKLSFLDGDQHDQHHQQQCHHHHHHSHKEILSPSHHNDEGEPAHPLLLWILLGSRNTFCSGWSVNNQFLLAVSREKPVLQKQTIYSFFLEALPPIEPRGTFAGSKLQPGIDSLRWRSPPRRSSIAGRVSPSTASSPSSLSSEPGDLVRAGIQLVFTSLQLRWHTSIMMTMFILLTSDTFNIYWLSWPSSKC